MKPWIKGIVVAAVHICLVASLGAKLLYDRSVRPRVWTLAAPYDPNLPIRGRYVRLQLVVELRGIEDKKTVNSMLPVILKVEGDHLIAQADPDRRGYESSDLHVQFISRGDSRLAVLGKPAAFFIPENVTDPSRRPSDEELWVEVTVPKKGPPRPIRLGVKKGDSEIVPLELN